MVPLPYTLLLVPLVAVVIRLFRDQVILPDQILRKWLSPVLGVVVHSILLVLICFERTQIRTKCCTHPSGALLWLEVLLHEVGEEA